MEPLPNQQSNSRSNRQVGHTPQPPAQGAGARFGYLEPDDALQPEAPEAIGTPEEIKEDALKTFEQWHQPAAPEGGWKERAEAAEAKVVELERELVFRDRQIKALTDDAGQVVEEATIAVNRSEAKVERLTMALRWALGEEGDFRARLPGEGAYWWRKELRARALAGEEKR